MRIVSGAGLVALLAIAVASFVTRPALVSAQQRGTVNIVAQSAADIRTWDALVSAATRDGRLRLRSSIIDPGAPAHTVERFQQFIGGVAVLGAEVVREHVAGQTAAIFGRVEEGCEVSTVPGMDAGAGNAAVARAAGDGASLLRNADLVIVRDDSGRCVLSYDGVAARNGDVRRLFVDARTGETVLSYSAIERQSAVGTGTGVLNDNKKVSASSEAGTFYSDDRLRPPVLVTYDIRGNIGRLLTVLGGGILFPSDRGSDSDNVWTDPAVVDAHVHMGWTYDFYFKRFGRRGYNGADRPIAIITNPVRAQDALGLPPDFDDYIVNAFWCSNCTSTGLVLFGSGLPPGATFSGRTVSNLAGALDVVAHEYTHAVTDSTSRLIYRNESGALNEAFSDVMGTAAEFMYHPPGSGLGQADYLVGEDVVRGARAGIPHGFRSMADPQAYGDPDHYSQRYVGNEDDGGVHINSSIVNHAYYLAIEGGTNRTSGLTVRGVGSANRRQVEDAFYRSFTLLLPASADFSTARAATLQAARDLFGSNSAAERALLEAWTAVGVQ